MRFSKKWAALNLNVGLDLTPGANLPTEAIFEVIDYISIIEAYLLIKGFFGSKQVYVCA
jgi:hypothetical protein